MVSNILTPAMNTLECHFTWLKSQFIDVYSVDSQVTSESLDASLPTYTTDKLFNCGDFCKIKYTNGNQCLFWFLYINITCTNLEECKIVFDQILLYKTINHLSLTSFIWQLEDAYVLQFNLYYKAF